MERDALIAHGTSFLLQDRLMNCSDYSTAWVCRTCGSLITLGFEEINGEGQKEYCRICDPGPDVALVKSEQKDEKRDRVGMVVKGQGAKKGLMDVVAVPCELSRLLVSSGSR